MSDAVPVLGVGVHPVTLPRLLEHIDQWAQGRTPRQLLGVYAHCLNVARRHPAYRQALLGADLVYADGMAVVWASRLLGRPLPAKIATTDLLPPLCKLAEGRGYRLYFLGGLPGVADEAVRRLTLRHPGLVVVGTRHGYFSEEEEPQVVAEIRAARPDLLLIGLGMPKQELWLSRHCQALAVPVSLTCGALFDFYSGRIPRCPAWMTASGLEWLFRLALEPRRLGHRYLVGNLDFSLAVMRERLFG